MSTNKSPLTPKKVQAIASSHDRIKLHPPLNIKQHTRVDSKGESGVIRRVKLAAQDQRRMDDIALREDCIKVTEQERKNRNSYGTPIKSSTSKLSKLAPERSSSKTNDARMNSDEADVQKRSRPCTPYKKISKEGKIEETKHIDDVRPSGQLERYSEIAQQKKSKGSFAPLRNNKSKQNDIKAKKISQLDEAQFSLTLDIPSKQRDRDIEATPVKKSSSSTVEKKTDRNQRSSTIARYNYSEQYRKNMKLADYFLTKDRKIAHYWLIARFLTNKEFQLKMIKKYKQFVASVSGSK